MDTYITDIWISSSVEFKIRTKHNLTGQMLRSALIYPNQTLQSWDDDPEHGTRLEVMGELETGHLVIAYLHPINSELGIWNLATAWRIERQPK